MILEAIHSGYLYGFSVMEVTGVLRKKKSRSLRGLLLQAVFVMQAPEQGRLFDAMTGWQLVPMVADRNAVLGGFRQART